MIVALDKLKSQTVNITIVSDRFKVTDLSSTGGVGESFDKVVSEDFKQNYEKAGEYMCFNIRHTKSEKNLRFFYKNLSL